MITLTCQNCEKEYLARRRDQKYCCEACSKAASRKRLVQGINSSEKKCHKCGKVFTIKTNAYNRLYCYDCVPEGMKDNGAERRSLIKRWALEEKGNRCYICGYDRCKEALDFHHLDPTQKEFNLSSRDLSSDWLIVKPEIDKCVLLCSNCHRELHAGLITLEVDI